MSGVYVTVRKLTLAGDLFKLMMSSTAKDLPEPDLILDCEISGSENNEHKRTKYLIFAYLDKNGTYVSTDTSDKEAILPTRKASKLMEKMKQGSLSLLFDKIIDMFGYDDIIVSFAPSTELLYDDSDLWRVPAIKYVHTQKKYVVQEACGKCGCPVILVTESDDAISSLVTIVFGERPEVYICPICKQKSEYIPL